jgi:flagellar basal body rod protein FlgB
MTALAETQADYQMATELYRKQIAMLKTAIGVNRS